VKYLQVALFIPLLWLFIVPRQEHAVTFFIVNANVSRVNSFCEIILGYSKCGLGSSEIYKMFPL
jgi:hypothetical protein